MFFLEFLKSLNWVDILVCSVFIRGIFIGTKSGFVIEFFKSAGLILSVFVCFHYFSFLFRLLPKISGVSVDTGMSIVFLLLWIFMFLLCKIIRDGVMMVFSVEAQSLVDKWGGALVGFLRSFTVASMILFVLLLSGNRYIESVVVESPLRRHVFPVAPRIYSMLYDGCVSKFFPGERYNPDIGRQLQKIRTH